jgi:DNA-binding FadR family transcriptional regulator
MRAAGDAGAFLRANMRFHLAVARASKIELLADLFESVVAVLTTTMTKASFVDPRNELLPHNIAVHADLISAIRDCRATSAAAGRSPCAGSGWCPRRSG